MYHSPDKYQSYVKQLNQICQDVGKGQLGNVMLIHGDCDYLVTKSTAAISQLWRKRHETEIVSIDAEALDKDSFAEFLSQAGLFDSASFFIIKRAEKRADLAKLLQNAVTTNSQNHVVINFHRSSLPANLTKALKPLQATLLACHQPHSSQLAKFIAAVGKNCGLHLNADALQLLQDNMGEDLTKLDNELRKLSLIFAERSDPLSAKDIAIHLGMLKEDDAFALEDILLAGKYSHAQLLLSNLIERGESPLAVQGILTRHCRQLIKVDHAKRQHATPRQISSELRLPLPVLRRYMDRLEPTTRERAAKALQICLENDLALKSGAKHGTLLLAQIITTLEQPHATR